jgi:hypothetical protein
VRFHGFLNEVCQALASLQMQEWPETIRVVGLRHNDWGNRWEDLGTEPCTVTLAEGPVLSKAEGPVLSEVEGPVLSEVEGPVLSEVEGPVLSKAEGPSDDQWRVWAIVKGARLGVIPQDAAIVGRTPLAVPATFTIPPSGTCADTHVVTAQAATCLFFC